jgi:hypothetical protein
MSTDDSFQASRDLPPTPTKNQLDESMIEDLMKKKKTTFGEDFMAIWSYITMKIRPKKVHERKKYKNKILGGIMKMFKSKKYY